MCSDFSLKSLIFGWSEEELGPNPFSKVGTCDRQFCLEFVPSELQDEEVPQQLQVVGELCADKGKAIVAAMSDTIVYTVRPDRLKTEAYDLKVLTIVTDMASPQITPQEAEACKCSISEGSTKKTGWAGHVTLSYPSGGQLITSMGHWMELSKVDTSLESVMRVAARNFGDEEAESFQKELAGARTEAERNSYVQKRAYSMVTKSVPSKMKSRTKYG